MDEKKANQIELLTRELITKAYLGKNAHYNAAARNKKSNSKTGLPVVVINILLGSVLFADLSESIPNYIKWIAAVMAFVAALMSAFQTFFKYQRNFEMHMKIANELLEIEHAATKAYRYYIAGHIDEKKVYKKYENIDKKYQEINRKAAPFPTNHEDYNKANTSRNKKIKKDPDNLLK